MTLKFFIALILRYSTEFDRLRANYVTALGFRKISSPNHIWPKLTHAAVV